MILGEYTGIITKNASNSSKYAWSYPSKYVDNKLSIDAAKFGSCMRYVNDLDDHNTLHRYI